MDTEPQDVSGALLEPASPAGEELLAELLQAPVAAPRRLSRKVEISLTIDQASHCYERLCGALANPQRQGRKPIRPEAAVSDISYLLDVLDRALRAMPQATPVRVRRLAVTILPQPVTFKVRPNEAAYLLRIVKNIGLTEHRETTRSQRHFAPLELAEAAEEQGGRGEFFGPSHPETAEAALKQAVIQKALGELSKRLRMPSEEVAALLAALTEAEGNVSEAARLLGQPQRKTARRVERIQKHLQRRGLTA